MSWDTWEAVTEADLQDFLQVTRPAADAAEGFAEFLRNRTEAAFAEFGGGGSGDVVGPASATDNALARFDGTTGKLLQNSGWTLSDLGSMVGVSLTINTSLDFSSATVDFAGATISNLGVGSVTGAEATANKGSANGYAELDSSALVPTDQLGSGGAISDDVLRGDQTWGPLPLASLPSHTHAGADITSGTVDVARLGSGSGSAPTWLNGVGAFDAPTASEVGAQPADAYLTQIAAESATAVVGDVLRFDGSAWQALQELRYILGIIFGLGKDGDVTIDGSTSFAVADSTITWAATVATLDRDWYGGTVTVTTSCTFIVGGFNVHLRKLIVESGVTLTWQDNGANGALVTGASGLSATSTSNERISGGGGAGRTSAGGGGNASNQSSPSLGGAGANGGGAGAFGGGNGATVAFTVATRISQGRPSGPYSMVTGKGLGGLAWKGGAGGGGGANSVGAGSSGGGGAGGGVIKIAVAILDNQGTMVVQANGGAGGGSSGTNNGGGGGGGGGYAGLMTGSRRGNAPTIQALGGSGGSGIGTGSNGSNGSVGTTDDLNTGV